MKKTDIKCPLTGEFLIDRELGGCDSTQEYEVENYPGLVWCEGGWFNRWWIKGDALNDWYSIDKDRILRKMKPRSLGASSWKDYKFPIIKSPTPQLISNELVSVQPMTEHRKDVNEMYTNMHIDYVYGPTEEETADIARSKEALERILSGEKEVHNGSLADK